MKLKLLAIFLLTFGLADADPEGGWLNSEPSSMETFQANAAVGVTPFTFNNNQIQGFEGPLAPLIAGGNSADLVTQEIQSLADGL